jgi:hypothetical protein
VSDQDILSDLFRGVSEPAWNLHAQELRGRGFSVFEVTLPFKVEFEIVSPDCLSSWQVCAYADGRRKLLQIDRLLSIEADERYPGIERRDPQNCFPSTIAGGHLLH